MNLIFIFFSSNIDFRNVEIDEKSLGRIIFMIKNFLKVVKNTFIVRYSFINKNLKDNLITYSLLNKNFKN